MWKISGSKIHDRQFSEPPKKKSLFKGKCIIASLVLFFNYNQIFQCSFYRGHLRFDPKTCTVLPSAGVSTNGVKTPFKIYIYDLPKKFNLEILKIYDVWHARCYSFEFCGFGARLFKLESGVHVHDSHQFSLEVLVHHLLQLSPYRTLDPEQADLFYIPAYIGLQCLYASFDNVSATNKLINELFAYLQSQPYFASGKPHFSSLAKIEREMQSIGCCPYLLHPQSANITFLSIERETRYQSALNQRVITVPYPSYIHLDGSVTSRYQYLHSSSRNVFILLAAGTRRSNPYRSLILDQFREKTHLSYPEYIATNQRRSEFPMVMYITKECDHSAKYSTVRWMLQSVFCLQPPGDSPTRKSFYDALLTGCVPVLFPYSGQGPVWAFQDRLNFTKFTVTIPYKYMMYSKNNSVYQYLAELPVQHVESLQREVQRVAHWFQYSIPWGGADNAGGGDPVGEDSPRGGNIAEGGGSPLDTQDAMTMIYRELENIIFPRSTNSIN